jgi:DNA-directed RNA polymerase subunit RPC12/RpoP
MRILRSHLTPHGFIESDEMQRRRWASCNNCGSVYTVPDLSERPDVYHCLSCGAGTLGTGLRFIKGGYSTIEEARGYWRANQELYLWRLPFSGMHKESF